MLSCALPACSDASGKHPRSRLEALTEESETAHKLFDNARLPPEAAEGTAAGHHGAVGSTAEAAAAAEAAAVDAGPIGRLFSALGNTLFFGGVAAASFFGYYTYRYDVDQVRRPGQLTAQQHGVFPAAAGGSQAQAGPRSQLGCSRVCRHAAL